MPAPEQRTWLLDALADLLRHADWQHFIASPIVLPTPAYFPDRWTRSAAGVQRLLRRLFVYADLDAIEPSVQLFTGERPAAHGVGQSTHHEGAAGLFLGIEDDIAHFGAETGLLGDAGGITATMAHEVAHAYRTHHTLCVDDRDLEERLTDLSSVFLGFGVLAANAALRHRSGVVADGTFTSRWSVQRIGYLSPQELCFLLAAQVHVRGPERAPARMFTDHLEANQASFFTASLRWLQRERPTLADTLGLPPRGEWPPPDSLATLAREFDETHDDMEVDATAEPTPTLSNRGQPVFRVWRRSRADHFFIGTMLLVPAFLGALALSGSTIAMLVWLALMVAAMVLADRQRTPRCSDPDCRAPIPTGPAIALTTSLTCPGCGGTIVGDIQHAEQRLAATEALARSKTKPAPTPPRRAPPLVIALPTAPKHNPDPE